jgi:hypothetical protein
MAKSHKVEIGSADDVIIDKLFGPTVAAKLRITANTERGWVIERALIKSGRWIEWCVIPMQIDDDFDADPD